MKLDTHSLIEKIRSYARKANLTKSALASKASLDNKTLKDFWNDEWNPTLSTLQKLEAVILTGKRK